jgi:hypothetical protein
MGGIAKQIGTNPKCLGSVSDHLHLCISQLQETVHPIEQPLRTTSDTNLSRRVLNLLKKQGAHFDKKYLWD